MFWMPVIRRQKMKVYYKRQPSVIVEPSFGYYRGWLLIIKNIFIFLTALFVCFISRRLNFS